MLGVLDEPCARAAQFCSERVHVRRNLENQVAFRIGPIALVDENMPIIVVATKDKTSHKVMSNIQEIKARKGRVIALTTQGNKKIKDLVDDVIYIPKTLEMLTPILSVVPLQLFAYHIGVFRGCDVDKPRNLAKSVTVE